MNIEDNEYDDEEMEMSWKFNFLFKFTKKWIKFVSFNSSQTDIEKKADECQYDWCDFYRNFTFWIFILYLIELETI